eukprot:GHVL01039304.1.p1 GENE.GHVL01039304.1~~GHVL01039304.1.p1  ORF type:complete len:489 (+),score=128.26 GHVL01039304.1:125-1591(+)
MSKQFGQTNISRRQNAEWARDRLVVANTNTAMLAANANWQQTSTNRCNLSMTKQKMLQLDLERQKNLEIRRNKMAALHEKEQLELREEIHSQCPTTADRMKSIQNRVTDLKQRREDERAYVVKEKLYQQWKASLDELRKEEGQVREIQVLAMRDEQLVENKIRKDKEEMEKSIFDSMWEDDYFNKYKREVEDGEKYRQRDILMRKALDEQVENARLIQSMEIAELLKEQKAMRIICEENSKAEAERAYHLSEIAKEKRRELDEFARIQREEFAFEREKEKEEDKRFVESVMKKEEEESIREANLRGAEKQRLRLFREALLREMAKEAESNAELHRLQNLESDKAWAKLEERWAREAAARSNLAKIVHNNWDEDIERRKNETKLNEMRKQMDKMSIDNDCARHLEETQRRHEEDVAKRIQQDIELSKQVQLNQTKKVAEYEDELKLLRQQKEADEAIKRDVANIKAEQQALYKNVIKRRAEKTVAPWDK